MLEENGTQKVNGQTSLSPGWMIAVAILLVVIVLGGLIYSFFVPIP